MRAQFLMSAAALALTTALATVLCGPVLADEDDGGWTGFYAGGNVGGANLQATEQGKLTHSGAGFVGGGQLGYNWQSDDWVFGIEGDVGAGDLSARRNSSIAVRVNLLSSLRARLGLTFDNMFVYATGGGALATAKTKSSSITGISYTYYGGVVGAGVEVPFAPQWTSRAEVLYDIFDQTKSLNTGLKDVLVWRVAVNYRL